jgi:ABC-type sugar transport system ATPase subunit
MAVNAPVIQLRGVVKRFGSITAVDGLDLDVPGGICLGLLGPNGAGKSTTMRLLTGQAIADEGEIRVLDHELPAQSKEARALMGVVPQLDNLDVDVSVEDNLAVFARLYRVIGEMAALQESRQAVAADALVRLAGYAPPNLHARAARVVSAEERYNVALSNAPGPQEPRYLAGCQMEEAYAFIPLAGDSALSIAVSSYAGGVFFGLLGDRSDMPQLDLLAAGIGEAVRDLVTAAGPPMQ